MKYAELVEDVTITMSRNREKRERNRGRDIGGDDFTIVLPRGYAVHETWRVINTDNFGGDYPNESFVAVGIRTQEEAQRYADAANKQMGENAPRHLRVVKHIEIAYVLEPGFEP